MKKFNFMTRGAGVKFLKKILKKCDLLEHISNIEDRFLPKEDRNFLNQVIGSLQKGKNIQVKKVNVIESLKKEESG
jgi:hypothetical protein